MEGRSEPSRRVSAVVDGEKQYFCCCTSYGCNGYRSHNPYDGSELAGRWCSHSTVLRHERAEKTLADIEKRIASITSAEDPLRNESVADAHQTPSEHAESKPALLGETDGDPEQLPIDSYLEELGSLLDIVNYAVLGFSVTAPLIFTAPPLSTSATPPIPCDLPEAPNTGPLRLSASSPQNEEILMHEAHLYGLLRLVEQYSLPQSVAVEATRGAIHHVIEDGLQVIMEIKLREWIAQRAEPHSVRATQYNYKGQDCLYIDCGK